MENPATGHSGSATQSLATGLEWMALAISVAASMSLLGWMLLRCRSGFDFTDEGFYLNWISNPWNYRASLTQFGFVYYPLYKLVGGDIALLRQANVSIVFALSCTLCLLWIRAQCPGWSALPPAQRAGFAGLAAVLASSSLAFFGQWLPTPSYNSLAFQSLLLASIGAPLAGRLRSTSSLAGWALIGIGGALAFLAKPTTAVMLGFLIAGYLVIAAKFALRGLLVALATAALLLVISGLAIDGQLTGFIRRYIDGLEMANRLLPGSRSSNVFRWDSLDLGRRGFVFILLVTLGSTALCLHSSRRARPAAAVMAVLLAALSIATVAEILPERLARQSFQPIQFWAVVAGVLLTMAVLAADGYRKLSRNGLALIFFFTLLPYAYALGTANNVWAQAAPTALFWLLGGFVVYAESAAAGGDWRRLLPAAAPALLLSTLIVNTAISAPYRQTQPLQQQRTAVEISREKSRLLLTEEVASYMRGLEGLAYDNGFRAGDPVIDLTGASPGSLYVLGARPMGAAWTLGGYPGSDDFLAMALGQETCESIGASWILTETNSRDALSPAVLERFGIHLSRDHLDVGSIKSVRAYAPKTFEHRLLKPARPLEAARLACEEARRTK